MLSRLASCLLLLSVAHTAFSEQPVESLEARDASLILRIDALDKRVRENRGNIDAPSLKALRTIKGDLEQAKQKGTDPVGLLTFWQKDIVPLPEERSIARDIVEVVIFYADQLDVIQRDRDQVKWSDKIGEMTEFGRLLEARPNADKILSFVASGECVQSFRARFTQDPRSKPRQLGPFGQRLLFIRNEMAGCRADDWELNGVRRLREPEPFLRAISAEQFINFAVNKTLDPNYKLP